jgi:hypothetical protein
MPTSETRAHEAQIMRPRILVLAPDVVGTGGIERSTRTLLSVLAERMGADRVDIVSVWGGRADLPSRVLYRGTPHGPRPQVPFAAKVTFALAATKSAWAWRTRVVVVCCHARLAPVAVGVARLGTHLHRTANVNLIRLLGRRVYLDRRSCGRPRVPMPASSNRCTCGHLYRSRGYGTAWMLKRSTRTIGRPGARMRRSLHLKTDEMLMLATTSRRREPIWRSRRSPCCLRTSASPSRATFPKRRSAWALGRVSPRQLPKNRDAIVLEGPTHVDAVVSAPQRIIRDPRFAQEFASNDLARRDLHLGRERTGD